MAYALANKPPRLACVLGRGLSHGQTSVVMPSQHANRLLKKACFEKLTLKILGVFA